MAQAQQYVTAEGLARLRAELDELSNVKRYEIADRIQVARSHGDISENSEYEDAKNQQAFLEGRIALLEATIKNASIIDDSAGSDSVVLGSTVSITSEHGEETYTIVGRTEARPSEGRISNESPIGRALLGHKKGDKVVAKAPAGPVTYEIRKIS